MASGLDRTFEVLVNSENLAALDLLFEVVLHGNPSHRPMALETLLVHGDRENLFNLVVHFRLLNDAQQERLVMERQLLAGVIRRAFVDVEGAVFRNACELIRRSGDYEQVPLLISAMAHGSARQAESAELLGTLAWRMARPDPGAEAPNVGASARLERARFLQTLRDAMNKYHRNPCEAIPLSYLLLADDDDPEIVRIIRSHNHPSRSAIFNVLRRESDPMILRWIPKLLAARQPSIELLRLVSERDDLPFVSLLLEGLQREQDSAVHHSLHAITELEWATPLHPLWSSLPERLQAAAISFLDHTSVSSTQKLEVYSFVLEIGSSPARQAAAAALAPIKGVQANRIALRLLDDPDLQVQLAAIPQLRDRGTPNALSILMSRLDHEEPQMRQAVKQALSDLSFERYLGTFDELDDASRRKTGAMILRIDPTAMTTLRKAMTEKFRHHRARALRAARTLGLVDEVLPSIYPLLGEEDYLLRREAIESLAASSDPKVVEQLMEFAAAPRHPLRQGALDAIEQLRKNAKTPSVNLAAQEAAERLGLPSPGV